MQFLTSAMFLSLAATSLAAPLLEQRAPEIQTITFYTATQYGGSSATLTFNTTKGDYCQNLPASVNDHAWSFKLSEQRGGISCRLHDLPDCGATYDVDTVFLYDNVPDLGQDPYVIKDRTSSVDCFNNGDTLEKRCGRGGYCPEEDVSNEVAKRCGRGGYCPEEDTDKDVTKRCGRGGYCPEEEEQSQASK